MADFLSTYQMLMLIVLILLSFENQNKETPIFKCFIRMIVVISLIISYAIDIGIRIKESESLIQPILLIVILCLNLITIGIRIGEMLYKVKPLLKEDDNK